MKKPTSVPRSVMLLGLAMSTAQADTPVLRHSADFFKFDGTEFFTGVTARPTGIPDGVLFYVKTVTADPASNVLYVSLYATGETTGAALSVSCRVTGAFCRPSEVSFNRAPPGWISVLVSPPADNGVAYQWCTPVAGGSTVTVSLKMATSRPGNRVFLEQGHVYIDSSRITQPDTCVQAPPPTAAGTEPLSKELAAAKARGEAVAETSTSNRNQ